MTGAPTACLAALHLLVWPRLEGWKGLPDDCRRFDVAAVFSLPRDAWWGAGELGEGRRLRAWADATSAAFPDAITVCTTAIAPGATPIASSCWTRRSRGAGPPWPSSSGGSAVRPPSHDF